MRKTYAILTISERVTPISEKYSFPNVPQFLSNVADVSPVSAANNPLIKLGRSVENFHKTQIPFIGTSFFDERVKDFIPIAAISSSPELVHNYHKKPTMLSRTGDFPGYLCPFPDVIRIGKEVDDTVERICNKRQVRDESTFADKSR